MNTSTSQIIQIHQTAIEIAIQICIRTILHVHTYKLNCINTTEVVQPVCMQLRMGDLMRGLFLPHLVSICIYLLLTTKSVFIEIREHTYHQHFFPQQWIATYTTLSILVSLRIDQFLFFHYSSQYLPAYLVLVLLLTWRKWWQLYITQKL